MSINTLQDQLNQLTTAQKQLSADKDNIVYGIIGSTPDVLLQLQRIIQPQIDQQYTTIKTYLKTISNQVLNDMNLSFSSTESPILDQLVSGLMMQYLQYKLLPPVIQTNPTGTNDNPTGTNILNSTGTNILNPIITNIL